MAIYPIVGVHFHPPARAILQCLPGGCTLSLIPEPTNEYDPNAVKVVVETQDIPLDGDLEILVSSFGFSLEDIQRQPEWHLGYIPRTEAEGVQRNLKGERGEGTLSFNVKGKPQIVAEY